MRHHTGTCKNVAERVDVLGLLVDETEYPIHQLGFATYIPATLQRKASQFAVVHKHLLSFMAFAWLIDMYYGYSTTSQSDTEKARTLMLLSVSGGRRKNPYNGDKPRARAGTRAIKPYRYHYTVSCEFPTFPDTIDNQLLPLFFSNKIIPLPCAQGFCLSSRRLRRISGTCAQIYK